MNTYDKDLSVLTLESTKEILFNKRCRDLIVLYNKDYLIENVRSLQNFYSLFTTVLISPEEVKLALLRKYYLSYCSSEKELNSNLERLDFEQIDHLIKTSPNTRSILVETYIDNLNTPNYRLPRVENAKDDYDKISKVLTEMDTFYTKKIVGDYPTLKKTYKGL